MKHSLFFILLCMASAVQAQTVPDALTLTARNYGDSVVLRWKPADALRWKSGNRTGYRLVRFTVDPATQTFTDSVVLTPSPLRPLSASDWQTRYPASDTVARGFARLLQEDKPAPNASFGDAYARKNANDHRFVFSLFYTSVYPNYVQAMALGFVDKQVTRNKSYVYLLTSAGSTGGLPPAGTGRVLVNTGRIPEKPAMPFVEATPGDKVVRFRWNQKLGNLHFLAYYYERSADGGKTFRRVSKNPFMSGDRDSLHITLVDSLPRNYQPYVYRIVGLTPFGDLGKASPNLTVTGRDLTPPAAVTNLKAENKTGKLVRLTWEKMKPERDLAGFIVGKSSDAAGPFKPFSSGQLPKAATTFMDTSANSFGKNYYVVWAVDTAGNATASIPVYAVMQDWAPPAKPTGLKGSIDSLGVIRISWTKNTEPDLLGYMVYTANAPDHDFTALTPDFLSDEFFTDSTTLRTLTKYKYFKVIAFDKSRRASAESAILALKRPDKIPPVSPVFQTFTVSDSTATIQWIRSSSDDVVRQILYRKEDGKAWQELMRFDSTTSRYADKTVQSGLWYSYALVAVDDAGLRSDQSFPVRVRPYKSGVQAGVKNLTSTLSADKKQIQLRWSMPVSPDSRVLVYRKVDDQELILIKNLPSSEQVFADATGQPGKYQYAVKVIYRTGAESPLSAFVGVNR